ncbi:hypothetical protein F3Y22_tig00110678pilonHSYRG00328 [Hibiscus syriacus]|uniref:Uncharacterized protein n=1 Tax=Hibiscus syriacus TaxID=106335 RepID=A0A6A2ZWK1_HIBSY|nr:hypothetical protein F3Y22_tig00110678pilonHSYRG00328 [Hibiscus syriacus]
MQASQRIPNAQACHHILVSFLPRPPRVRPTKGTHELLPLVGDGEPSCSAQVWCWHGQWSFSSMGIGDMGTWDKASGGTSCCWEWSRESRCSARVWCWHGKLLGSSISRGRQLLRSCAAHGRHG